MGPVGKDGFAVSYSRHEPPHNPLIKLFHLVCRKPGQGSEEPISGGGQVHYCPRCGSDLAAFPRAANEEPTP